MSERGFRYALEPVLAVRSWRVEALQRDLAASTDRLEAQQRATDASRARLDATLDDWRQLTVPGSPFDPARAAAYARHAVRLERQAAAHQETLQQMQAERERVMDALVKAARERDALQDHRREQHKAYLGEQADAACKVADEHWIASLDRTNRSGDVHQT